MTKILIVEDDIILARNLIEGLKRQHFIVEHCTTAEDAEYFTTTQDYDLLLLDLNLPGEDGLDLCRDLRQAKNQTPIIIMTERDNVSDRILGLDTGADDYLPKPFSLDEMHARIRSVLRRHQGKGQPTLEVGPFKLDPTRLEFQVSGKTTQLAHKEFGILEMLMTHANEIIPREKIINSIWGDPIDAFLSNTLEVHISKIRKALGDKKFIKTFNNRGYMFLSNPPKNQKSKPSPKPKTKK